MGTLAAIEARKTRQRERLGMYGQRQASDLLAFAALAFFIFAIAVIA